mmetsp:Transcript_68290/g.134009  ORF Transcript_68290/g.134009 Transcript_68290/m.134009 type:complete len:89 (-) Transcript_68290:292-558(-)
MSTGERRAKDDCEGDCGRPSCGLPRAGTCSKVSPKSVVSDLTSAPSLLLSAHRDDNGDDEDDVKGDGEDAGDTAKDQESSSAAAAGEK